jgi:hypothetical protein
MISEFAPTIPLEAVICVGKAVGRCGDPRAGTKLVGAKVIVGVGIARTAEVGSEENEKGKEEAAAAGVVGVNERNCASPVSLENCDMPLAA